MPIELETASLDYSSTQFTADIRSMSQDYSRHDYSDYRSMDTRSVRSDPQSVAKSAFTNFTESLSHSTEEIQHGVKKTFSSIASSFSRSSTASESSSESGSFDQSTDSSSSGYSSHTGGASGGLQNMKSWTEFAFGEAMKSRVSSLTSSSSYSVSSSTTRSSNDSSLSSRSASPRMNSDKIAITVDKAGIVLRESSDDHSSSSSGSSSVASWQETASRDVSLLDTIGENGEEDEEDDDDENDDGSSSGSETRSEGLDDDDNGLLYDYDDDSTEFNSDVGLEDLGAVMLQIGSCQFEPESASLSFDDEEYSYNSSGLVDFSRYVAAKNAKGKPQPHRGNNHGFDDDDSQKENDDRNTIFMKRLHNKSSKPTEKKKGGLTSFLNKAFSCGGPF
ncbi:expressed unknown protein [Seminavis robusta]|uniref:Uncharacterized protein n=1 Tax=Seminavis robusta TaxID=568900 RepID=A0A9N8HNK1_9STRA|nr:expressed unknown protein [Seminavis robusta]|eukprot:Sro1093_g240340.1 n/a (391) ;mRNA; f:3949-5237